MREWFRNIALRVTNDIVGMWNTKHTINTGQFFLIVFLFSIEGYYIRYLDPINLTDSIEIWGRAFGLWFGVYLFVKLQKVTPQQ